MRPSAPNYLAHRCMPVSEWPEMDRVLRERALVTGDIIDGAGPLAGYRPATLTFLDKGYGRWLQWLQARGELDPAEPPLVRITPQRTGAFIQDLLQINSTKTIIGRLAALYYMGCVQDPAYDLSWIRRDIARVKAHHKPVRDKKSRMVGIEELYQLGLTLMETAPQRHKPRWGAVQFRDGLMIAMLAASPRRSVNMRMLRLDESFVFQGGCWWIVLPTSVTKAEDLFAGPLPAALNDSIAQYLNRYRPMLLERRKVAHPKRALWISQHGKPMSTIYQRITNATFEALGRRVNPHLFRDCAATSIAMNLPNDVRIVGPVLGHADLRTSESTYNQAGSFQAASAWQEHLLALRRKGNIPR